MPQFRDPVHGLVYVSEDEKKIIDSTPFQRLRNIRQLATTYLVYHGAEHTRFGHSIGVMHLVTRVFDSVTSKLPEVFRPDHKENKIVIAWYRQILRLIALTHDLGHAPFSHATEDLFAKGYEHEHYTKRIIEETIIAEYINDIGDKLHKELANTMQVTTDELIEKYNVRPITPQLLWMIYGEKPSVRNSEYIWPDFVFLKSFMDGELDCDKMDYLLRDSLFCGVTYGKYDLERFISTLEIYKNEDEKVLLLAISSGGVQVFEEFVLARYFMFIQVYFHKTRRYFDKLLVEGLKEILPAGKFPVEIEEYLSWDDARVISEMKRAKGSFSQQYINRKSMTCVFETPAHATKDDNVFVRDLLDNLKEAFPDELFQIDDVDKKAHKLLPTIHPPEDDGGGEIKVVDRYTKKASNVMDCSLILSGIIAKIYICRLYARGESEESIDRIKKWICEYGLKVFNR